MKLRIFGAITILATLGAYVFIFTLANRWMEHLQRVNDDPFGYWYVGALPMTVPLGVIFLISLWSFGPIVGQAVADWLR